MGNSEPAAPPIRPLLDRRTVCLGALACAGLAACAGEPPPTPLAESGGQGLILGPGPEFDPARLPVDWWRSPRQTFGGFAVATLGDVLALRIDAPGGPVIGRRLRTPLLAMPYMRWGWYLEPALYGGGFGDGLDRGLRLVIGCKGGQPKGVQLTDRIFSNLPADYPMHDHLIELVFGGVGAPRAENATQHLTAVNERGLRQELRSAAFGQAGHWQLEALDLAALYRMYWPRDLLANVDLVFVAVGGLPGRLPPVMAPTLGYVAEILLSR